MTVTLGFTNKTDLTWFNSETKTHTKQEHIAHIIPVRVKHTEWVLTCSLSAWWCYEWWLPPCQWWHRRTVWVPAVSEGCLHAELWGASLSSENHRGAHLGSHSQVDVHNRTPSGFPPAQSSHQGCRRHAGHCSQTGNHSASGWPWEGHRQRFMCCIWHVYMWHRNNFHRYHSNIFSLHIVDSFVRL